MRGQVIDVPAGSALNTALGANIIAMTSQQQVNGSSDSVNVSGLENKVGGGNLPYNQGQVG
jgi:hypothetical protein